MQPQNQNPRPQPSPNGAWDFLNTPEPPQKQSFFKTNRKIIIIVGLVFGLLILLAVIAAASGGGSVKKPSNLEGPTTSVPTTDYNKETLSFKHASVLNVLVDEQNEEGSGWYVLFNEDKDSSDYNILVKTSTSAPIYADGTEAVSELLDVGVEPTNVVSSDVILAGEHAKKTVGEFTGADGREYYVVYSNAKVGSLYVTVSGTYLKDRQDITDSFDAMIGSIKLK